MNTKRTLAIEQQTPLALMKRALRLGVVLALLWYSLAGNAGWGFGAMAIVVAILISLLLAAPQSRWRLLGLLRFVLYFLKESLLASIDVARLAFRPRLSLNPALLNYNLRLPTGPARTLFILTIGLVPGTLVAELEGDTAIVHVLDADMDTELARLEQRVADVFAIPLGNGSSIT